MSTMVCWALMAIQPILLLVGFFLCLLAIFPMMRGDWFKAFAMLVVGLVLPNTPKIYAVLSGAYFCG